MAGKQKRIASKQRAASDARRAHLVKDLANKRLDAKNKNPMLRFAKNWRPVAPVANPGVDENLPNIHPALGHWTEDSVPNIYWNLANPDVWTYKRAFTEDELERSPFEPEQEKISIALCPEKGWVIDLKPRPNRPFMTLRCFQEAMAAAMKQDVPRSLWHSANFQKKYAIAMAYLRRTDDLPLFPHIAVFHEWGKYLNQCPDHHNMIPSIDAALNAYAYGNAPRGMTHLKVIDLLGENTMFAGLMYLKEKDVYVLYTTSRHIASMAHHLLPRPNPRPVAPQPILQPGPPPMPSFTAPNMPPMPGAPMVLRPPVGPQVGPYAIPYAAFHAPCPVHPPVNPRMVGPAPQVAPPVLPNIGTQYVWCGRHMHM